MKSATTPAFFAFALGLASLSPALAQTAQSQTLTGKAAAEKLVGNTLEGHKPSNDERRAMYFRPDGALFTHNPKYPFDYPVIRWKIIEDKLCLVADGAEPDSDSCATVEITPNAVNFIMPDADPEVVNRILPGNHYNKK